MEKIINYDNEFYVIETDNIEETLNHLKNEDISECVIYDLINKNLRTYHNKAISINPIYPNEMVAFSYGKHRDKCAKIFIENGVKCIKVYTKQNPKSKCIYDSKTKITCR